MDDDQAAALNGAIRTIAMRHRARAGAALARLGLAVGQEMLLVELSERGACTQAQLAAAAGCEPPTITEAVRKLEEKGLVTRSPSPHDGRAKVVDLTPSGRRLLPKLAATWRDLAEASVAGLSRTNIDDLIAALSDLASSLRIEDGPDPA